MIDWGAVGAWISTNKDWLFSGLAIAVAGGIFYLAKSGYLALLTNQIDKRIAKADTGEVSEVKKIGTTARIIEEDQSTKEFEIESYWGFRPSAHEDMRKDLYSAKSRIFVAGGGLTTIVNIIKDPTFVKHLSGQINQSPDFSFTVIMDFENEYSNDEEGRVGRQEKINKRKLQLSSFRSSLSESVSEKISRPLIVFKKYNEKVTPRHFLLAVDETIYIGSYLSHQEGQYSYLLKIKNTTEGVLYRLLNDEIEYVGKNTSSYDLD